MRQLQIGTSHALKRQGFTMLELLTVIGIIALVLSTFAMVLANYVQAARVSATRATISKIDAILKDRLQGLRKQDFTDAAQRLVDSGTAGNLDIGKTLAIKQAYRFYFPQQSADNSKPPFDQISTLTSSEPNAESAAYLYSIITRGATFGTPTVDETSFTSSETKTENGITYFVDAWGEPLRYYRSPTRLFWQGEDLNGNGSLDSGEPDVDGNMAVTPTSTVASLYAQARLILAPNVRFSTAGVRVHPLRIDSDDRLGRLNRSWGSLTASQYQNTWTQFELNFQTVDTFSTPLILSAGPDKELGLASPMNSFSSGQDAQAAKSRRAQLKNETAADIELITDNLTNLNTQAGGGN
ncbi:prepilin-type N-terminal cleavage/methylation domain-containing protein [bacterium]|nr:prepilin-type N-terminal cleavage/methylation domain-containing protein [bacterium]